MGWTMRNKSVAPAMLTVSFAILSFGCEGEGIVITRQTATPNPGDTIPVPGATSVPEPTVDGQPTPIQSPTGPVATPPAGSTPTATAIVVPVVTVVTAPTPVPAATSTPAPTSTPAGNIYSRTNPHGDADPSCRFVRSRCAVRDCAVRGDFYSKYRRCGQLVRVGLW
jgi:hypothetical protein